MRAEPRDLDADHCSFRRRALAEAARYGSDPYVFVRELLQNARDAGARRVEIEVSCRGSRERVTCRDDGCGMTFEHARRYLFALYASSKEESSAEAGKFGIGFWSVLRFAPSTVTIRSRAASRDAWQVTIDGRLDRVTAAASDLPAGTEVVLERPAGSAGDLGDEVYDAVRRYGRFLTRRDAPQEPLEIDVDGRIANAELTLPSPSSTFRGRGFRGVVGLGPEPRVELFAQGLFVRSAGSLRDLRDAGEIRESASASTEDALAEMPSLAPQVLIDSAELDLLLARSDARCDRHLRRVLRVAEKQLGRLISRRLRTLRPQPWFRLALGAWRERLEPHLGWPLAAAGLAGVFLGAGAWWWLSSGGLGLPRAETPNGAPGLEWRQAFDSAPVGAALVEPADSPRPADAPNAQASPGWMPPPPASVLAGAPGLAARAAFFEYSDLARNYSGPRPGGLAGDRSRLAMLYEPAAATPLFNALVIEEVTGVRWAPSPAAGELPSYPGTACRGSCVAVRLLLSAQPGWLRIPLPTGHRLDVASLRLDGEPAAVFETPAGEAVVRFERPRRGLLEYRSGPAPPPPGRRSAAVSPAAAPELAAIAAEIRHLPLAERVQAGLDYVSRRVVYDRSSPVPVHAGASGGFVAAALAAGAGDCDVQNGVLVTLLRLAGIDARLAVGYVGLEGAVAAGLHAWVEYADELGALHVADASVRPGGEPLATAAGSFTLSDRQPAGSVAQPGRSAAGLTAGRSPARIVPWAAAVLAVVGCAGWWLRRRGAGAGEPGAGEDLAALLGGALQHPEAFSGLPAMFHGRFVPLLGREGLSLAQARRLGQRQRLFRSGSGSRLARRAAARGVPVIDASTAAGRVVSLALGAIDLDRWSSLLEGSTQSELCGRINRMLESLGAPWRVRELAPGSAPDEGESRLSEPWIELALENLKLGRRLLLLNLGSAELAPARRLLPERPEAAAFTVLDALVHRLDMAERERARILAGFARASVAEAALPGAASS